MRKIVFLDSATLVVDLRRPAFAHTWVDHAATHAAEVWERAQDADIVVSNKVPLDSDTLSRLPQLKMVAIAATGVNHVDLDACRERGIVVSNIRDYSVHTVPEHVFMLLLALRRNLPAFRSDVRNGAWQRSAQFCLFTQPVLDLYGSTLGILGRGAIGSAVGQIATAFGMHVLYAEHKGAAVVRPGYAAFDIVLRESDALTLHLPLNAQTQQLIGPSELALMPAHALLINTARGGLVDENALAQALRAGRIAGAGFDVLSTEPPTAGNPLLELDLPNFILTPHVAWSGRSAMQALADQLIDNIEAFVAGTPRNRVA